MARVDRDGNFIDVNQYLCDMLGYSRESLILLSFAQITHPEDLEKNNQTLARALRGEIDTYRLQKRYLRANGEILWADLNVSVERDVSGHVLGMISIITDIGAFKLSEERLDFLLGELAHRSKNLFAVVLSLVERTTADTIDEFRSNLSARIHSLAASQDLMLGEVRDVASFGALVDEQLKAFVAPQDPRVIRVGANVPLGSAATRVIGMALHELATNSCKYGALSVPQGRIHIIAEFDPQQAGQIRLAWVESGGPEVTPPARSGFGRRVIERMVARALDAQVTLDFAPGGVVWSCSAQAENLLQ